MTEKLAVLGSTGSVGRQALDVCRHLKIKVTALSAGKDIKALENLSIYSVTHSCIKLLISNLFIHSLTYIFIY